MVSPELKMFRELFWIISTEASIISHPEDRMRISWCCYQVTSCFNDDIWFIETMSSSRLHSSTFTLIFFSFESNASPWRRQTDRMCPCGWKVSGLLKPNQVSSRSVLPVLVRLRTCCRNTFNYWWCDGDEDEGQDKQSGWETDGGSILNSEVCGPEPKRTMEHQPEPREIVRPDPHRPEDN